MANWQNKEGPVTTCDAAEDYEKQKKCDFFEKARNFERCMYLVWKIRCDYLEK